MIEVDFATRIESRFLDRKFAASLSEATRVTLAISGDAVMTTARRLLRKPAQKSLSEMTEIQRQRYRAKQKQFKEGKLAVKPRRPNKTSKPGESPRLHSLNSLLKTRLLFALAQDKKSVVIGPELIGRAARLRRQGDRGLASVEQLEESRPFMAPALQKVTPKIPSYINSAFRMLRVKG